MKASSIAFYRCPVDGSPLSPADASGAGELGTCDVVSQAGRRYAVENGIPNFLYPEKLSLIEEQTKSEYDRVADEIYDIAVDWQFAAFNEDEDKVREGMVDLLGIDPSFRVLEVGCGTGRDSFRLARRLGKNGALFMQDLSPRMVQVCEKRMGEYAKSLQFECELEYSVSNATFLPFPDNFFDAVFHFGGFNQFGDLKKGASELARVAKPGGRILLGDEAVAPWLKGTEFDGIVTTNNALFKGDVPLSSLPLNARDVTVKWIIANCFYVITFTKGDGIPQLQLDMKHAGWRGGSMRSRYFGVLEGVTPEAKAMVREAAARSGVSVHDWLDRLLKLEAEKILKS